MDSSWTISDCNFAGQTGVFTTEWYGLASGSAASIASVGSTWLVTGTTFDTQASFVSMIADDLDSSHGSSILFSAPDDRRPTFYIADSVLQSLIEVFRRSLRGEGVHIAIEKAQLCNTSMQSLVAVYMDGLRGSSISVKDVELKDSSCIGINADLIQRSVEPQDVPIISNHASLSIRKVRAADSNWVALSLKGAGHSLPENVSVTVEEHEISRGQCQMLSLYTPSSQLSMTGQVDSITVENASVQLADVEGIAGSLMVSNINLTECTAGLTLIEAALYTDGIACIVFLADIAAKISVSSAVLRASGNVKLILVRDAAFSVGWYNSTSPAFLLDTGIKYPQLLVVDTAALSLSVDRCGATPQATPLSLLSVPSGGFELKGYFFEDTSTDSTDSTRNGYSFRKSQQLQCPAGYSFRYNITLQPAFFEPYTLRPYNCLSPIYTEVSSCFRPAFSAEVECVPCAAGTVSFSSGSAASAAMMHETDSSFVQETPSSVVRCLPCPSAFVCGGGPTDVTVLSGHWTLPLPSLWEAVDWSNSSVEAMVPRCPEGACDGPAPLTYSSSAEVNGSLCTRGRDPASALCSLCQANASASVLSGSCVQNCTWDGFMIACITFVIVLMAAYVIFLFFRRVSPQSPWIRIVTYYYSVLLLLYDAENSSVKDALLQLSTAVATVSAPQEGSEPFRLCLPGSHPIHIKLLRLLAPFSLFFVFIIIFFVFRRSKRRRDGRKLVSGLFSILLISYSSIAGTVFSFLPCVQVPELVNSTTVVLEYRLLQNAVWPCWSGVGWAAVLLGAGVIFVFGVPVALFVWQGLFPSDDRVLYRLLSRRTKRGSSRVWRGLTFLSLLEGSLRVWYWDAFLFMRRALLEMVYVFAPRGITQQSMFALFNTVFLCSHAALRPYTSTAANVVEALSLCALLFVGVLNIPKAFVSTVPVSFGPFVTPLSDVHSAQSWVAFAGFVIVVASTASVYLSRLLVVVRDHFRVCYSRRRSVLRAASTSVELAEPLVPSPLAEEQSEL